MITAYWKQYFATLHSTNFSFDKIQNFFQMTWNRLLTKPFSISYKNGKLYSTDYSITVGWRKPKFDSVFNRTYPHSNPVTSRMLVSKMLCNKEPSVFLYDIRILSFITICWKDNLFFLLVKISKCLTSCKMRKNRYQRFIAI